MLHHYTLFCVILKFNPGMNGTKLIDENKKCSKCWPNFFTKELANLRVHSNLSSFKILWSFSHDPGLDFVHLSCTLHKYHKLIVTSIVTQ